MVYDNFFLGMEGDSMRCSCMIIKTDIAEFGNFKDLETYMRLENVHVIELLDVRYFGINLSFTKGLYTYEDILDIIKDCG